MKKLISIILTLLILTPAMSVSAGNSYIDIDPLPDYHVLGEDIVIYGKTDCSVLAFALYKPKEHSGWIKYSEVIFASDLKKGYHVRTVAFADDWYEGEWTLLFQYGDVREEIKLKMYNPRMLHIAEYEDDTLVNIQSYNSLGTNLKDNVLTISMPDDVVVKIFSWNNLDPIDSGPSRIFIAEYKNNTLTDIKTYYGTLSNLGNTFTLKISETKYVRAFFWSYNLKPIT